MRFKVLNMKCCLPVFAFCLLYFAGIARGEESDVSADKKAKIWFAHLRQCTAKTFSLTGRFTQDFTCNDAPSSPVLRGTFELRRNGNYRLTYTEPKKMVFTSDGSVSSVLERDEHWTASGPVDVLMSEIVSVLTGKVPESFHADFLGGSQTPDDGLGVLRLTPQRHRFVQSILVTVSPESPCIRRVTIVDTAGCIIRTTLDSTRINTGVKARRFQIRPPKNSSIVDP